VKMKQGKFNIGRQGEEIVVHDQKEIKRRRTDKKGAGKTRPFS
jgi:hypothetical protein